MPRRDEAIHLPHALVLGHQAAQYGQDTRCLVGIRYRSRQQPVHLGVGVLCVGLAIILISDKALANSVILVVTGATAFGCGFGSLVIAALVGLAVYRRLNTPAPRNLPPSPDDAWQLPPPVYGRAALPAPPTFDEATEGSWTSAGLPAYDLAADL